MVNPIIRVEKRIHVKIKEKYHQNSKSDQPSICCVIRYIIDPIYFLSLQSTVFDQTHERCKMNLCVK